MKSMYYLTFVILIIFFAGFFMLGNSEATNSGNAGDGGDAQKIILSLKNLNYYPNTITAKMGEPTRIYLDESVTGCFRSFTIRDFGVAKYLRTSTDYLEFTPNKKGTFRFACAMGMGTGTLIVE